MNDRERYLATMNYQPRDRCPMWDFGFWDETLVLWHADGLPDDVTDNAKAARFFGMDDFDTGCSPNIGMLPGFEAKTIKEDDQYRWVRRGDGAVEMWHKHSTTIPEPSDFFLKDRQSWREFKKHFDPDDPRRIPADYAERLSKHRDATRT